MKRVLQEQDLQLDIDRLIQQKSQAENQMRKLVDKLLEGILSDSVYKGKQKELEEQIEELENQIERLEIKNFKRVCFLRE